MKILILSDDFPPYALGGAGGVAFTVAQGLLEKGHQVSVITSVRDKKYEGESLFEGIKIYSFCFSYNERWRAYVSLNNPIASSFVKKVLEKEKPDVVHAHNIHHYISYYALKLAKKSGACVVLTAHDCMLVHYGKFTDFINPKKLDIPSEYKYRISSLSQLLTFKKRYNPFRNLIIKRYLKYVDTVTAVSQELKKVLEINRIKDVEVVHNALDISKWKIDSDKVKEFISISNLEGYKRILFAGKLTKAKGGEELIKALMFVKNEVENIALIIAGQKDAYTAELVRQAEQKGIKTIITGWMQSNSLPNIYEASDLVVFPSTCFDTFGMVNLEAMATRKPVIATCFGGAREVVVDNETGYIINPYNTAVFAQKIISILNNKDMAIKMGEAGYEVARKNFNLTQQVEKFEEIYKREVCVEDSELSVRFLGGNIQMVGQLLMIYITLHTKNIFEFLRYGITGVFNTLLNIFIFNLLMYATGIDSGFYVTFFSFIAFVVVITQSFFINAMWVFKKRESLYSINYRKFFLVSGIVALVNILIIHILVNVIGAPMGLSAHAWANIALLPTIVISVFGNFLGYKLIVFK